MFKMVPYVIDVSCVPGRMLSSCSAAQHSSSNALAPLLCHSQSLWPSLSVSLSHTWSVSASKTQSISAGQHPPRV